MGHVTHCLIKGQSCTSETPTLTMFTAQFFFTESSTGQVPSCFFYRESKLKSSDVEELGRPHVARWLSPRVQPGPRTAERMLTHLTRRFGPYELTGPDGRRAASPVLT